MPHPNLDPEPIDDASLDAALDAAGVMDQQIPNPHALTPDVEHEAEEEAAAAPLATDLADKGRPAASTGGIEGEVELETTAVEKPAVAPAAPLAAASTDPDSYQTPRNLSSTGAKNWGSLRTLAASYKKEADQAKAQLASIQQEMQKLQQAGAGDPQVAERLKALESEVSNYRAIYASENSAEFKAAYDQPIIDANGEVNAILTRQKLSTEMLEEIKAAGGLAHHAKLFTELVGILRGYEHPNENVVMRAKMDANKIEGLVAKIFDLESARERALADIPGNREKFAEAQKAKQAEAYRQYDLALDTHWKLLTKDIPFARLQEIPANATPEQKAEIERNNAKYHRIAPKVWAAKWPKTPEARAELMMAVGIAFAQDEDIDALNLLLKNKDLALKKAEADVSALQAKLAAIHKAGRTNGAGGATPTVPLTPTVGERLGMSDDAAIDAGMAEAGI